MEEITNPYNVFDVTCPNCGHDINEHVAHEEEDWDTEFECSLCKCDWTPRGIASCRMVELLQQKNSE